MSEHAFAPNWPHGHYLVNDHGDLSEARIRLTDVAGDFPIVAEWFTGDHWRWSTFTSAGRWMPGHRFRLINRPAPEPMVVDTKQFTIEFASASVRDAAGLPVRANVCVECEFLSDGFVRASAEVVK